MRKRKIVVTESELIRSIEKIVKEQAAMLGFGNMGGLSMGVSKPSDKYELDEDSQDTNTSDTINVNYMDQNAANQSMEDWEMGEDYNGEEELGEAGERNFLQRGYDWFKDRYVNEGEDELESLIRKNLKENKKRQIRKWIS